MQILTTLVMLFALAAAYGRYSSDMEALQRSISEVNTRLARIETNSSTEARAAAVQPIPPARVSYAGVAMDTR